MPDDDDLPLGLSMLWENADPEAALASRFGFADLAEVSSWLRSTLAQHWGLEVEGVSRLVISDHNAIAWAQTAEAGAVIVKWSAKSRLFPRLLATAEIIAEVGDAGIPVASPLATRSGAVRGIVDGPVRSDDSVRAMSMTVLPEVTGTWLDPDDLATVRLAGAALARLHSALAASVPDPDVFPMPTDTLREQMETWLADSDPGSAPAQRSHLRQLIGAAPAPPCDLQLVHRDFRAANILVDGPRIAAVLDFDEVVIGHPISDLAQASVLLATRFREWGPTTMETRRALLEGYESERPLDVVETAWFEIVQLWIGIAMAPSDDDVPAWTATH